MKKRIKTLKEGDLDSKIKIISNDELADLSSSINKMISDIKSLGFLLDGNSHFFSSSFSNYPDTENNREESTNVAKSDVSNLGAKNLYLHCTYTK